MAAAAYESDDSGGASSSDESVDIDFHGIKHTVFQGNMAAVEKEIEQLEKACPRVADIWTFSGCCALLCAFSW